VGSVQPLSKAFLSWIPSWAKPVLVNQALNSSGRVSPLALVLNPKIPFSFPASSKAALNNSSSWLAFIFWPWE
jgi:hypothetical protein